MKFSFIFSNLPDIKAKTTAKIKTSIQIPDEIIHLIGVEERIREIGKQVGTLTKASLHISCTDLGIKEELMNTSELKDLTNHFTYPTIVLRFTSFGSRRSKSKILNIIAPHKSSDLDVPKHFLRTYGRNKKIRGSLAKQVRPLSASSFVTDTQITYYESLNIITTQLIMLLNADPQASWSFDGFHPYWHDKKITKKAFNEMNRLDDLANQSKNDKNAKKHGQGNRFGAIPGKFMGVQFHSQLEIRLATALQQRGIEWIYEEERLGDGNYLVDFHLPQHKAWVEVKGRFEARDHFLLKEVAEVLEKRGEKLYVFTSGKAMIVTADEFKPIPRKELWALIEQTP